MAKAIEWLRKTESKLPERIRDVRVDRLPNRRMRDAVVIDFTGDGDQGSIQVVLERDTGELLRTTHARPKGTTKSENGA